MEWIKAKSPYFAEWQVSSVGRFITNMTSEYCTVILTTFMTLLAAGRHKLFWYLIHLMGGWWDGCSIDWLKDMHKMNRWVSWWMLEWLILFFMLKWLDVYAWNEWMIEGLNEWMNCMIDLLIDWGSYNRSEERVLTRRGNPNMLRLDPQQELTPTLGAGAQLFHM